MKPTTKILLLIGLAAISSVSSMRLHVQQAASTVTYDSLKSRLDSTIDYKYYDNLNSPSTNFYYGTITKEAYDMSIKLYKLDDYEQCPGLTPYATKDMQSCMTCPTERPLFNLGTRECEQCKAHVSAKCDALFNITAPAQTQNNTVQTATNTTNTTNLIPNPQPPTRVNVTQPGTVLNYSAITRPSRPSSTPNTSPTTSPSSFVDSSFIVEWKPKPKIEDNSQQPEANLENQINIFEPVPFGTNDGDLHENYTVQYRVSNNQTNTTKTNQTNGQLIAQSKGDNAKFSDQECPLPAPFYNPSTKTCQNCKENEEYVPHLKKCLPIVWVSNPKTKYVILKDADQLLKANLNVEKANPERTVRQCPIDKPLSVNNSCMACPAQKIFNFTSQSCQDGCPDGQIFSEQNSKCINATFLTNSEASNLLSPLRDFEEFRAAQKQRVKSSATIVECPLTRPFMLNGVCSTCPDGLPYFNIQTLACESCTRNRNYNSYSRKCESSYGSGLEVKRIVPNIF